MGWGTALAIYFIIWWVMLFAVLPIGLRTQQDDEDVTLGTVPSAPRGRHMGRVLLITTILSGILFLLYYVLSVHFGFGFDRLPNLIPD